jgi:hypothetical protein
MSLAALRAAMIGRAGIRLARIASACLENSAGAGVLPVARPAVSQRNALTSAPRRIVDADAVAECSPERRDRCGEPHARYERDERDPTSSERDGRRRLTLSAVFLD